MVVQGTKGVLAWQRAGVVERGSMCLCGTPSSSDSSEMDGAFVGLLQGGDPLSEDAPFRHCRRAGRRITDQLLAVGACVTAAAVPLADNRRNLSQSALDHTWTGQVDTSDGVFITAEGRSMCLRLGEAAGLIIRRATKPWTMSQDTCARCPETSQMCPRGDLNPHAH